MMSVTSIEDVVTLHNVPKGKSSISGGLILWSEKPWKAEQVQHLTLHQTIRLTDYYQTTLVNGLTSYRANRLGLEVWCIIKCTRQPGCWFPGHRAFIGQPSMLYMEENLWAQTYAKHI